MNRTIPISLAPIVLIVLIVVLGLIALSDPGTSAKDISLGTLPDPNKSSASLSHMTQPPQDAHSIGEPSVRDVSQLGAAGKAPLSALYLECAQGSSDRRMDIDEAVFCQAVADHLMRRHFEGDLDRLIQWWHSARSQQLTLLSIDYERQGISANRPR